MHWRHVGCCREELCLSPACLTNPNLAVSQVLGVQQPGALLLQSPQGSPGTCLDLSYELVLFNCSLIFVVDGCIYTQDV